MVAKRAEMTEEQRARANEASRRYRLKNAEKIAAGQAKWAKTERGKASKKKSPRAWRQAHPEKAAALEAKAVARLKAENPEAYRAQKARGNRKYREKHGERLRQLAREIYRRQAGTSSARAQRGMALATAAIPRNIPPEVRDDVLGDIMLALIDGTVRLDEVTKKVPDYIRAHNRKYNAFRNVSLDAVHSVTGHAWIENLDSDTEHF